MHSVFGKLRISRSRDLICGARYCAAWKATNPIVLRSLRNIGG
jgi:hypothetical protein